ncbi:hypothetical protein ILUMI_09963 [Ignelater luminosus]|uniref:Gamma-interferon-inducible lysosomal thiol reductase n=1 Tax=Ignelater luminosus TaxID=2038154 RepID=A0A8K0GE19_IGNLU|nr:hypothetical protein ILUMI_09963 [Ignelater luminosus]
MRFWLVVTLLTIFYTKQTIQNSTGRLKVSVFYESLCPDSVRFITRQLYPAYEKIGSSLLVDFVPYGKATHNKENGKWIFQCQHGANECWGNKAQACGIAENKGQDKTVNFVKCVMSEPYPANEDAINKCAPELDVPSQQILECSESVKGDELLVNHGERTHAVEPKITFIPTIVFNDKYDAQLQSGALSDFLWTACSLFTDKPSGCPSKQSFFMDLS